MTELQKIPEGSQNEVCNLTPKVYLENSIPPLWQLGDADGDCIGWAFRDMDGILEIGLWPFLRTRVTYDDDEQSPQISALCQAGPDSCLYGLCSNRSRSEYSGSEYSLPSGKWGHLERK